MASRTVQEYVTALDELDAMKAAGNVSENQWAVQRGRLLAEAVQPARTGPINFLIFAGVVFAIIGMLAVIGYLVGAVLG